MAEFKVNVSLRWWVPLMVRLLKNLAILRILSPDRFYQLAMWAARRGLLVNGRRMGA